MGNGTGSLTQKCHRINVLSPAEIEAIREENRLDERLETKLLYVERALGLPMRTPGHHLP